MSSHILESFIHEHHILNDVWMPLFEEELTWQVENTDDNTLFVDRKTDLLLVMFQESCTRLFWYVLSHHS